MSEHMSPIPSRVYNAAVGGHVCGPEDVDFGQKVVHLVKYDKAGNEVSFESQVTQVNKIYVIHDDFVLSSNVTIPSNCVLEFDGGSISGEPNCTLNMNDCYLKGEPLFDSVVFSGNIKNDCFDATWIKNGNDIGAKLNYAQTYFKKLCTPHREYDLSTPVLLSEIKKVYLDGIFTYTGPIANLGNAIKIELAYNADILINELLVDSSRIDYTTSRIINFIGIRITSCNNCSIKINVVAGFNENVRTEDIHNSGCCYNHFWFLLNRNTNAGVRFYQEDTLNGSISWCNENAIHSGRFTDYGAPAGGYDGERYAIFIGGPAADLPSYHVSKTDSYDSINCITIENCSMEGRWKPIYSRNCIKDLKVINCREEDNYGLAKFVGENQIYYIPKYKDVLNTSDFSESDFIDIKSTPKVNKTTVTIDFGKQYDIWIPNQCILNTIESTNLSSWERIYGASAFCGYILDTRIVKVLNNLCEKDLYVQYLNSNYTALLPNMSTYPKPNKYSVFNSNLNAYEVGDVIIVPDNVDYIFVGVRCVDVNKINEIIKLYSLVDISSSIILKTYENGGTFNEKPATYPIGLIYFDTTNNRPIFYNGTAWVDVTGTPV